MQDPRRRLPDDDSQTTPCGSRSCKKRETVRSRRMVQQRQLHTCTVSSERTSPLGRRASAERAKAHRRHHVLVDTLCQLFLLLLPVLFPLPPLGLPRRFLVLLLGELDLFDPLLEIVLLLLGRGGRLFAQFGDFEADVVQGRVGDFGRLAESSQICWASRGTG